VSFSWKGHVCLVTGGSGFGGAHLCALLLELGAEPTVLDLEVSEARPLALLGLGPMVRCVRGDARDVGLVRGLLDETRAGTLFHLAAQPLVPRSVAEPYETLQNNALAAYAALEAARTAAAPPRFVFASSGAYYGTTSSPELLREEDAPRDAENLYAPSKVAGDIAVRCYARTFGLKAAVCRFMNTYGPADTNSSRIVPRAVSSLLSGGSYDFGDRDDGTTRLDYMHVRDMAAAYAAVAERLDEVSGEAFNFGGGRPMATRELARLVSRLYDGKEREPVFSGPRRKDTLCKVLDTRKAGTALGWRPSIGLEDGLRETIRWYRSTPSAR